MKYRVHRLEADSSDLQVKLESYLNSLDGEIVAVIPHVRQLFMMYGAKTDYFLIVEKIK